MNRRIASLGFIAAIAIAPPVSASQNLPPSAVSVLVVPPGRIDRAVRSLDSIARAILRKTGIPGISIAVVHGDRVVYLKGFGVRKAGTQQVVDADTVFELASLSKTLGAAVVAGAVGRGVVSWSDPVAKYLTGFTLSDADAGRTVTIGDMYAHRSGLPDHAGDLLEDLGFDRATILERLQYYPLDPFRITYHYTNFGLTAAAVAVANATGMSWEQLSRESLYAPLGMTSTSSRFSDYENSPNHAVLHVSTANGWAARYTRDADAQSPAGGASSSARDMARFLEMELNEGTYDGRQIVGREALLETRNPNLMSSPLATADSRASFYGYGIGVGYDRAGRLRLSHSGAFSMGAATTFIMLPSERLGIVVLTNAAPVGAAEALAAEFMDLAEFGKVERDWYAAYSKLFAKMMESSGSLAGKAAPANPIPALVDAAYVGTYANRLYGNATVGVQNGSLVLHLGPKATAFPLVHWSGNTFAYAPGGENATGSSAVTFAVDKGASSAAALTIEDLNEDKLGTFVR
jgi:CubicO group peptidase (beta-lactamase class C family)